MAVTLASLRQRVKNILYSAEPKARPFIHTTNGTLANGSATSLVVTDGTNYATGDTIEFTDDGERAHVVSVSVNTLTLIRNIGDVTNTTGHATGLVINKNPRFTQDQIDDAIEDTFMDLWPYVWKTGVASFVFVPGTYWYPIADGQIREIRSMYYEEASFLSPTPITTFTFTRGLNAGGFTQAQGIYLPGGQGTEQGDTVYYNYRAEFSAATELLDRQAPLVAYGAAYLLMGGVNARRTADPGRWTDRTVQPGAEAQSSIWMLREFQLRRRREELRLKAEEAPLPISYRAARARRFRP